MASKLAQAIMLPYQLKVRNDTSRFKLSIMPRQSGKDFTHMEEAVATAMCTAKTDVLVSGPGERQALETLDKAKDWMDCYKYAIADMVTERPKGPQALVKAKSIILPNRSRIIAVPGTPDRMRGYCAHTYITEFDFLEDSFKTFNAFFPSCTNPLKGLKNVRLYSTPNSKAGKMWKLLEKNFFNLAPGARPDWSVHHMTIYDCIRMGLNLDIEAIRRALDDDEAFAQEYLCEFRDSSNVLLPYEIIELAESIEATETIDSDFFRLPQQYPTFCGIDFGRVHDPTVCWTLMRVGHLLITKEVLVLRNMPMPKQWELLRPRVAQATKTALDYTGLGIGVGDEAVMKFGEHRPDGHKFGKIELCTFTPKLKRHIFPHLRKAFEAPTKLRIPISIEIREDLHAMQQVVSNGEYDYYAPRTKDGHSDRCTALALSLKAEESGAGLAQRFIPAGTQTRFGQAVAERRDRSMQG